MNSWDRELQNAGLVVSPPSPLSEPSTNPAKETDPEWATGKPTSIQPPKKGSLFKRFSLSKDSLVDDDDDDDNSSDAKRGSDGTDWTLTKQQEKAYGAKWSSLGLKSSSSLEGSQAFTMFMKSGLPRAELATIWSLVDPEQAGSIRFGAFKAAHRLIDHRVSGTPLPATLPWQLGMLLDGSTSSNSPFFNRKHRRSSSRGHAPSLSVTTTTTTHITTSSPSEDEVTTTKVTTTKQFSLARHRRTSSKGSSKGSPSPTHSPGDSPTSSPQPQINQLRFTTTDDGNLAAPHGKAVVVDTTTTETASPARTPSYVHRDKTSMFRQHRSRRVHDRNRAMATLTKHAQALACTPKDSHKSILVWQDQDTVFQCPGCNSNFNVLRHKRSNCRTCGKVVCNDCMESVVLNHHSLQTTSSANLTKTSAQVQDPLYGKTQVCDSVKVCNVCNMGFQQKLRLQRMRTWLDAPREHQIFSLECYQRYGAEREKFKWALKRFEEELLALEHMVEETEARTGAGGVDEDDAVFSAGLAGVVATMGEEAQNDLVEVLDLMASNSKRYEQWMSDETLKAKEHTATNKPDQQRKRSIFSTKPGADVAAGVDLAAAGERELLFRAQLLRAIKERCQASQQHVLRLKAQRQNLLERFRQTSNPTPPKAHLPEPRSSAPPTTRAPAATPASTVPAPSLPPRRPGRRRATIAVPGEGAGGNANNPPLPPRRPSDVASLGMGSLHITNQAASAASGPGPSTAPTASGEAPPVLPPRRRSRVPATSHVDAQEFS